MVGNVIIILKRRFNRSLWHIVQKEKSPRPTGIILCVTVKITELFSFHNYIEIIAYDLMSVRRRASVRVVKSLVAMS